MKNGINVKYRLDSIENETCLIDLDGQDISGMNSENLRLQYKIETVVKMEDDRICVRPSVRFLYGNGDNVLLQASVDVCFCVDALSSLFSIDRENQEINAKVDVMSTFLAASYSTLRGVVFARTQGTELAAYPLPLISVRTLMEKNAVTVEE